MFQEKENRGIREAKENLEARGVRILSRELVSVDEEEQEKAIEELAAAVLWDWQLKNHWKNTDRLKYQKLLSRVFDGVSAMMTRVPGEEGYVKRCAYGAVSSGKNSCSNLYAASD